MRYTISLLITILLSINTYSQNIRFTASSESVVAVGERFRLVFSINAEGDNFRAPAFKGFRVLSGPNPSTSSSFSMINGKTTQSINKSFSYILEAVKAGKFTIKGAQVSVENKTYTSNSIQIEVVKQNANTRQNSNSNRSNSNGNQGLNINNKDLFLRPVINKKEVFIGEPIQITYKLYTRVNLADLQNISFPEYRGFYAEDIEVPQSISLKRENYKGTIYNTALLNKVLLYPQTTGDLKIGSASIDAIIQKRVQRRRRDIFDDFFGGGYKQYKVPLKSSDIKIKVKPLPEPVPTSFNGAVGHFKIKATVDKTDLKANDAFTYKITISGKGNLKLLKDPELNLPHDFDVWDPTIKNKINHTSSGSKGSKTYEYVVQPRHPGDFTIPAYQFSYFDPNKKQFINLETESFQIKVSPSEGGMTTLSNTAYSKEDVAFIGKDIRYIKTKDFNLKKHSQAFFGSLLYYLSYILLILAFAVIIILKRQQIKNASNVALMRNKKAKKKANKLLKEAKKALEQNQTDVFYEAINKALQKYLCDKLNIDTANYTSAFAVEQLESQEIDKTLINEYKNLTDIAEMARYAPSQINEQPKEIYDKTSQLIGQLDAKIKNK